MKREKRGGKNVAFNEQIETDMQEELEAIPTPRLTNLWPVTMTMWFISIPHKIRVMKAIQQAEKERIEREIEAVKQLELDKIRQREEIGLNR